MNAIDIQTELDRTLFNRKYFDKQPVVYKGAVKHIKAFKDWSLDYLKDIVGERMIEISHSNEGLYTIADDGKVKNLKVPFQKAIDLFSITSADSKTYYLQESSMFENFPELLNDLEIPQLNSPSDKLERINLWMGGKGCVTKLHYDGEHNFLAQIRGAKELVFFPPEDTGYLYVREEEKNAHESEIDIDRVDHEKYPLFKLARKYYAKLEPGDALYLPPGWWHQVRSLEMSISVNYWYNRFDIQENLGLGDMPVDKIRALISLFTENGFSINHRDEEGQPLLLKAIRLGYTNVVEAFLSLGADPDLSVESEEVQISALDLASRLGYKDIVNVLVRYGAGQAI